MAANSKSQRATVADRKVVFRSVLDSPYKISWPVVPLNIQNLVLASLVTLFSNLGDYHVKRQRISRKRKRAIHDRKRKDKASAKKRRKIENGESSHVDSTKENDKEEQEEAANNDNVIEAQIEEEMNLDPDFPEAPPIAGHLSIGINCVTKRLETQVRSLRMKTSVSSDGSAASPTPMMAPITHVFVCRSDVDNPIIISHLPELVAACNKPIPERTSSPVYLVPLPKGSEETLAATIGLPRASIIAMDGETPGLESVTCHLFGIQAPVAPWLTSVAEKLTYELTHIKQLRTTAPKDMHLAKKARVEGRKAAKERRLEQKKREAHPRGPTKDGNESNRKRKQKKRIRISATDSEVLATGGNNRSGVP